MTSPSPLNTLPLLIANEGSSLAPLPYDTTVTVIGYVLSGILGVRSFSAVLRHLDQSNYTYERRHSYGIYSAILDTTTSCFGDGRLKYLLPLILFPGKRRVCSESVSQRALIR